MIRAVRRVGALVAVALVVAACSVAIPPAGSPEEQRVIEQGREIDRQIEAQFGFYDDTDLAAYVDGVGQKLAAVSEWPSLPWHFRVLDSPVVNAFAVPGGYIYVTRGILAHMNSEAELAGVLGHEVAHVTSRHAAEQQLRSTLAGLGLLVGSVVSPTFADVALGSGLAQQALGLILLRYSREQELESDEKGIGYAARAGYDPRGIAGFFQTLQALEAERGGRRVPGWASTHPEVEDRIERGDRWAQEALAAVGTPPDELVVNREGQIRAVDGIVFGEDPRQGYMSGGDFLHPELEFALTFPSGWDVTNARSAVTAIDSRQRALLQLTLADGEGSDPQQRGRQLLTEIDARVSDSGDTRVNGLAAWRAVFEADTQDGTYAVRGIWIGYGGQIYQLLGITSPARYDQYAPAFSDSQSSFRRLQDAAAINVQPARVDVVQIDRSASLRSFVESRRQISVDPTTIALINAASLDEQLSPGRLLKTVVGGLRRRP